MLMCFVKNLKVVISGHNFLISFKIKPEKIKFSITKILFFQGTSTGYGAKISIFSIIFVQFLESVKFNVSKKTSDGGQLIDEST